MSNGNGTPQVLEYLRPWVDLYKVDLKSFDPRHYRELGGRIEPILETIRQLHAMDFWLEIVTLLIPGFNDSPDELKRLTEFVASVSPDIPWHVTAFHGDYKMDETPDTTPDMLMQAADIGREAGLNQNGAEADTGQQAQLSKSHESLPRLGWQKTWLAEDLDGRTLPTSPRSAGKPELRDGPKFL